MGALSDLLIHITNFLSETHTTVTPIAAKAATSVFLPASSKLKSNSIDYHTLADIGVERGSITWKR
jgi:hypothetical protein